MKSKKIKVTVVAILATLTFATTAFAGIFDVLGAVVGGVLGVTTQPSQEQLENFHKDYLNKVATKVKQTGDIDAAAADIVAEQKKFGYTVSVVQNDNGQFKSMDVSGGNLPVTVKCALDRQQQTITISYADSNGAAVGNTLTKKYDLPGGVSMASASSNQATQTAQTQGSCASGISSAEMNTKFSIMPSDKSLSRNGTVEYVNPNGQTGCPAFDSSQLKGNIEFIKAAYLTANINQNDGYSHIHTDSYIEVMCDQYAEAKKDPFMAPQIKNACKQLIAYYRAGGHSDYRLYCNEDHITDNPLSIDTKTDEYRSPNAYKLAMETFFLPWPSNTAMCYAFKIPSSQMGSVFNQLQSIAASNKAAIKRVKDNAYKKNFQKQKVTVIRFSSGFDTPIGEYDVNTAEVPLMRNAYLSIRLLDGYVTYKNYDLRYEFPSTQWKELLGYTVVDAVKRKK